MRSVELILNASLLCTIQTGVIPHPTAAARRVDVAKQMLFVLWLIRRGIIQFYGEGIIDSKISTNLCGGPFAS